MHGDLNTQSFVKAAKPQPTTGVRVLCVVLAVLTLYTKQIQSIFFELFSVSSAQICNGVDLVSLTYFSFSDHHCFTVDDRSNKEGVELRYLCHQQQQRRK